ncbi:ankyrin repeats (3 copies) domain-containing protein [Hirsutella rhossiliensis]|uniref:Ankyrin repeats (3 copies) domain-containing protein n=1 Tax=Hirsutella rhossiliensis TaxID=111463 RepID=A0A9P8MUZ7_9HYPO|nr:ankyrin repeats (3 copies) domain-containing protein [Hirsutella rhossiliensis]KAH0961735.1 ankyrin repeats (3 copies) domain-containing protein [Hirsutella rhossiliensis]
MPHPHPKPTEDDWLCYKSAIRRLYLVDDVPLRGFIGKVGNLDLTHLGWLLSYRVDSNTRYNGKPPLEASINKRLLGCTRMLLMAGAMDHANGFMTSLEEASRAAEDVGVEWSEDKELIQLMLRHSPRSHCDRVLGEAIETGSVDIVHSFVRRGANLLRVVPPLLRKGKTTALGLAASVIWVHDSWPGKYGEAAAPKTALMRFILHALVAQYPSRSISSFVTPNVFISAAEAGNMDVLQYLCTTSPSIGAINHHGFNALHAAASRDDVDACDFVLGQKVPVNTPSSTLSALHIAALWGHDKIVDLPIQNGTDLDAAGNLDIDLTVIPGRSVKFDNRVKEVL